MSIRLCWWVRMSSRGGGRATAGRKDRGRIDPPSAWESGRPSSRLDIADRGARPERSRLISPGPLTATILRPRARWRKGLLEPRR